MENVVIQNLTPVEYASQRVLLSRQVAQIFDCEYERVKKIFQGNPKQFVRGQDYFLLEGEEQKKFRLQIVKDFPRLPVGLLYLWTKGGVKIFSRYFADGEKVLAELEREYFAATADVIKSLVPVDYANQRVLLSRQIAQVYNCSEDVIKKNFSNNREQYVEGVHYFVLTGAALEDLRVKNIHLQISPLARTLYLWTYRGAVRHCKSINTPQAWAQFDKLEEFYFKNKQPAESSLLAEETAQPKVIAAVDLVEMQEQIDGLKIAFQAVLEALEANTKALREQVTKLERAEKLLEVAKLMEPSPEKQKLLLQAANLIAGKKLF